MERALELLERTVNAVDGVDTEQTGAWLWEYGESAMRIRLEYHIEALDRWKEVRGTVNKDIQNAFEEGGLDMAVPTRTIRMDQPLQEPLR